MESKYNKKYLIETARGLQDVDGLKNSSYFTNQTNRYIKGEITLDELDKIITSYYKNKPKPEDRSDEADIVATKIAKKIGEDAFTFSIGQLQSVHKFLFNGLIDNAGEFRTYNFIKKEWVLEYDTVTYGDYRELEEMLAYDFKEEKKFNYKGLSVDKIIEHLADFVSKLWQIHAFSEGNTRTVATFFIKYLRTLGIDVTNDTFKNNSWYFRNALVRANYTNISKGIYEDKSFLVKFLRNLILKEKNILRNRDMLIQEDPKPKFISINRDDKLIDAIECNPTITTNELSSQLKVSIRTVKNILKRLQEEKTIKRVGGKKLGYWKILK